MHSKPDPDKYLEQLGNRIKALRIKAGYPSYEVFAYEHNISRAQWGRYEKGHNLTFVTLITVISALDITLEDFFATGFDEKVK